MRQKNPRISRKLLIQNRYRLLKQIGKGDDKTFLASDEGKFPPIPCVVQQFRWENQTPEALKQSSLRLEELGEHPQIPAILAHFEENHHFYRVLEYIEGINLATLVEEMGAWSETQIWQLLEDLLPVLQFIHDRNVIHGDLKPENIIRRTSPNTVRLTYADTLKGAATQPKPAKAGFVNLASGFSLWANPNRIGTSPAEGGWNLVLVDLESGIGSPEYAAPEQVQGKTVFASDLYSLGVTCIYLLTQIPPFDLFDVTDDCWVWRQYLTTKVSERLGKIIDKLLQKDISYRFQSADEVMQAMGIYSPIQNPQRAKIQNPLWQCSYTLTGNPGRASNVNSIAISPEGNFLASGNDDKTIQLWDLNTKKLLHSFAGHSQAVKSVAFSPDGKILATASDDKTIKLWNLSTCQEIYTLLGHTSAVKSVTFSADGKLLASGSWDKKVKLWDVETGKEICTLMGHQLQVSAVAFSPQNQFLASASLDRTICLWRMPLWEETRKYWKNRPDYTLSGHTWAVLTVAFSPDGKILATGSEDNTIKLWEVDTGQLIGTLLGHSWAVATVAFSTDGETLISGSWDKTIKLWSVSTKKEMATLSNHVDSVFAVAVSPVAQLIASGSRDKTIKLTECGEIARGC